MQIINKITKKNAISKDQFNKLLKNWLDDADFGDRIGDVSKRNQTPWIFVQDKDCFYYLNADSTYDGVKRYLEIKDSDQWYVIANTRGILNKVAFGEDKETTSGFYLYIK